VTFVRGQRKGSPYLFIAMHVGGLRHDEKGGAYLESSRRELRRITHLVCYVT